uniref:Pancreatic lipase-related protein 2-like n=1 Tax=Saccoglossus kowalevskii TaxID=10224 RepID=A0ABM0MZK4_SACKO|nr:PREDICTED: pancreatic lipase-related protein 2-like [Saccoglossus kowalevskii]
MFITSLIVIGIFCSVSESRDDTVCYGDLGCFTNDPPFDNVDALPEEPEDINTGFWLYTRQNRDSKQVIDRKDPATLHNSYFDDSKDTKFIIHGWLHNGDIDWVSDMKHALLDKDDLNVIQVDWSDGAFKLDYFQCVANTRVVGAETHALIEMILEETSLALTQIHLIGHSLGAHISGYVGEYLNIFPGRITGLDPAGPRFENEHVFVRLDSRDAFFVDVIHTDAEPLVPKIGLGIWQESGHVDFYPNGGKDQPSCDGLVKEVCDHMESCRYFIESINNVCKFTSYNCDGELGDWSKCASSCDDNQCNYMGYYALNEPEGVFYLETNEDEPFCQG